MALQEVLPVKLTPEELVQAGAELAETVGEIEDEQELAAGDAEQHRDAIKALRAREKSLALKVRTGTEDRPVDVEEHADYDAGEFYTCRLDTGERVHARPMSESERRRPLPLDGREDGVPASDPEAQAVEGFTCRNCGEQTPADQNAGDGFCSVACIEEFGKALKADAAQL